MAIVGCVDAGVGGGVHSLGLVDAAGWWLAMK